MKKMILLCSIMCAAGYLYGMESERDTIANNLRELEVMYFGENPLTRSTSYGRWEKYITDEVYIYVLKNAKEDPALEKMNEQMLKFNGELIDITRRAQQLSSTGEIRSNRRASENLINRSAELSHSLEIYMLEKFTETYYIQSKKDAQFILKTALFYMQKAAASINNAIRKTIY